MDQVNLVKVAHGEQDLVYQTGRVALSKADALLADLGEDLQEVAMGNQL